MPVLVLVRHALAEEPGRCAGQRFDPPLGTAGRAQAADAALRLGPADLMVSSPARRARATAGAWGMPVTVDERLAERDFGDWEGQPWSALWDGVPPGMLASAEAYAELTPPGGEPLAAVARRVTAALDDLAAAPAQRIVAVTHAGPLRLAVAAALGLPPARALGLAADHARAAVLERDAGGWRAHQLDA